MHYYDEKSPKSIENYSKRLINKTFRQIIDEDLDNNYINEPSEYLQGSNRKSENKGKLGQIIEEHFFHYKCNSDSRADFPEAGVELKVTPFKFSSNGRMTAKERLIITMIDYMNIVDETFETSHFWSKSKLILLVYYLYKSEVESNLDYTICFSNLFTPSNDDLCIIKRDFELIVNKIKEGKAHELSEGDTLYLGAATKSATSKNRRAQPFSDILAKPRAFAFKQSYMTYVLNNYIVSKKENSEKILKDNKVISFEEYVTEIIEMNRGKSVEELSNEFSVSNVNKPKHLESILAYRMLGIKGNKAEEFIKANVVVKSIRIENNNRIKENMSFPVFKFKELVSEEWENSTFGNYLRETRFFFVIYKYDKNNILRLQGCQFWNIPYNDLENEVKKVWKNTKQILIAGLQIRNINNINYNNFPKQKDNRVCHVRPHARNAKDTDELPDGRQYTKQCFWLNGSYIYDQLRDDLKY